MKTTGPSTEPYSGSGKLAIVSMVRDESDIIELFLRINSRQADAIYVLDHFSVDGTREIVQACMRELPGIHYHALSEPRYLQGRILSLAVRKVAASGLFTHVMPLDADEFVHSAVEGRSVKQVLAEHVGIAQVAQMPWRTFCPVKQGHGGSTAPLHENFRQVKAETKQEYKVVMGCDFAKHCHLAMGSHSAMHEQYGSEAITIPVDVQHVPIRSEQQLRRKISKCVMAMQTNTDRRPGQAVHWEFMASILDAHPRLDDAMLFDLARSYGALDIVYADAQHDTVDAPRVGLPTDVERYAHLAKPRT